MNSWGQLFDIVEQLSPTAQNCQPASHPENANRNATLPMGFRVLNRASFALKRDRKRKDYLMVQD
jgi:hypothetical protein